MPEICFIAMNADINILEDLLHAGTFDEECPYLAGKKSSLLFLHGENLGLAYRMMMDNGYRRYGRYLYRTDCPGCTECRILRIPVHEFAKSRSQRRIWKKGKNHFTYKIDEPSKTEEKSELYRKYLEYQHSVKPDLDTSYDFFFTESFLGDHTRELQLFFDGRLCGVGIVDFVSDALSSVYFYFDPDIAEYSPGTYSVLLEIEIALDRKMKFYYPGFYIRDAKTMSYKANFRPCYIFDRTKKEWVFFAEDSD